MKTPLSCWFSSPRYAAVALLVGLAGVWAGCATRGYQQAAVASNTLTAAATESEAAQTQINRALAALELLSVRPNDDLRPVFADYRRAVSDLEGTVSTLDRRANEAEAQRQRYLETWDQRMAEIRNPDILERSRERQREVVQGFDDLQGSYVETRDRLVPLMQDLRDLQRMLEVDLTAAGVEAVRDLMPRMRDRSGELPESLTRLADDFRDVALRLDADTSMASERARR